MDFPPVNILHFSLFFRIEPKKAGKIPDFCANLVDLLNFAQKFSQRLPSLVYFFVFCRFGRAEKAEKIFFKFRDFSKIFAIFSNFLPFFPYHRALTPFFLAFQHPAKSGKKKGARPARPKKRTCHFFEFSTVFPRRGAPALIFSSFGSLQKQR